MKPTKHARTNFRMLSPFLEAVNASERGHMKFHSPGYMSLSMESLGVTDYKGRPVFSMTHYGYQNGDLMADPDMTFAVDFSAGEIDPRTYQNDYIGIYQEVYTRDDAGRLLYSRRLRPELDEFLWQWLKNILDQGFSPEVYDA